MFTAPPAPPPEPSPVTAPLILAMVVAANGIRTSADASWTPFDVVRWTALAGLLGYAVVRLAAWLLGRQVSIRTDLRLQAAVLALLLGVGVWGAVANAVADHWELAGLCAALAAFQGALLWTTRRQLSPPAPVGTAPAGGRPAA